VGVGVAFAWAFAFACHVHAQGKHFQDTCSGACFFGCSVSWWAMLHFVACGIARHDVYSWGQINPQKTTHQIDRICGAREYCAVVSALSIWVCEEHTVVSMMLKKDFGRAD
jgi:H+/Cl- antiporter ClcA